MSSGSLPPAPLTPEQVQDSVDSFEDSMSVQQRVASSVRPILVANADLCEKRTVFSLGFEWITINDLPFETRREVGHALDVGETPSISYVEAGSPAARAGLRRGDLLLTVNYMTIKAEPLQATVASRREGVRPYREYLTQLLADAGDEGTSVRLSYQRGGVDDVVELQPQERCDVQVTVAEDASKALSSKGRTIYLSRGLYEFVQSDAELQALIAHQLADFIRGHGTRTTTGTIAGGIVGGGAALGVVAPIAILGTVLSVLDGELDVGGGAMEVLVGVLIASAVTGSRIGSWIESARKARKADYLSTYLLARTGVNLKDAMNVWSRLSEESDVAPKFRISEARLTAIDKVVQEVTAKRDSNEPLIPNSKMKVSVARD